MVKASAQEKAFLAEAGFIQEGTTGRTFYRAIKGHAVRFAKQGPNDWMGQFVTFDESFESVPRWGHLAAVLCRVHMDLGLRIA